METNTNYGIPKFHGNDFAAWKIQVCQLLREKRLFNHVDDKATDEDLEDEQWDISDEKAKGIIIRCLANPLVVEFGEEPTAFDMWSKILNAYEKRTAGTKAYLIMKICSCVCDEAKPLEVFFRSYERDLRAFKAAGGTIDDLIAVFMMLSKIPRSYDSVKDSLLTLGEEDLTFDRVKNRLLEAELERKGRDEASRVDEGSTAAFNVKQKRTKKRVNKITCFNCGEQGHKSFKCPHPKKSTQGNKFGGISTSNSSDDKPFAMMTGANSCNDEKDTFRSAIDSGATDHMFNDVNLLVFSKKLTNPMKVSTAKDGQSITAMKGGTIVATTLVCGRERDITINNALYVPDLKYNLVSVSRMRKAGATVVFEDGKAIISRDGVVVAEGHEEGGLYWLTCKKKSVVANVVHSRIDENQLWHRRLGHLCMQNVVKLVKMSKGMSSSLTNDCLKGKQSRLPFKGTRPRATRPLYLVHSDICGPVNIPTQEGYRYFVTFIDDYTHMTVLYLMKTKDEMFECFKRFKAMSESHFGKRLSNLRCDNGGEYTSRKMKDFCNGEGILIQYTTPYTPELNGVAERMNRTLVEKAKSMLAESDLSTEFWGQAICTAVYLINRSPTDAVKNKTPYEMYHGRKPDLSGLKIFGCHAFVQVPKHKRAKFETNTRKCIMIGYGDNGYRLWDKNTGEIVLSRDVKFDETRFEEPEDGGCSFDDNDDEVAQESSAEKQTPKVVQTPIPKTPVRSTPIPKTPARSAPVSKSSEVETTPTTGRSVRIRRMPLKFDDYVMDDDLNSLIALNVGDWLDDVPSRYCDIEDHPDEAKWRSAVDEEIDSLEKNETWTVVKFEPGMKLINSRWIFKQKPEPNDEVRFKARLVAKGFMQKPGIDYSDTYSPVAKLSTIRMLLAVGIQKGFQFCHLDVRTAFLNGCLEERVFMKAPEGIQVPEGHVLKLNRSLYGLKQSPRCWNKLFNDFIVTLNFQRSTADYCLYTRVIDDSITYLVLYVDDMLICSNDEQTMKYIQDALATEFEMKNLGSVRNFMGLNIEIEYEKGILTIDQSHYIRKILERFDMSQCNPASTPIEQHLKLERGNPEDVTSNPYRELIGSLMYVMLGSRPDICYAIGYLSRFQDCSNDTHFAHLKRVLRYLKGTINWKLSYERRDEVPLRGFVDADFGNDINGRKSTSGLLFQVYGNTMLWTSKKQDLVTISTSEAEYVAASLATCDAIFLTKIMNDLHIDPHLPVPIHEDNAGCIFIAKNPETKRSKHIDVKYHFIRECVETKKIELIMTPTANQIADVLTKGLGKKLFLKFVNLMGLKPGEVLKGI